MSVCAVFRINERNKLGYLAVLGDMQKCQTFEQLYSLMCANGVSTLYAVKYWGSDFGEHFSLISNEFLKVFNTKTCRSKSEFAKYVKEYNPMILVNPLSIGSVIFDIPYIHLGSNFICNWKPTFTKFVDKKNIKVISEESIVEYNYHQPIFILIPEAKRHVPKVNEEILLINTSTGAVTWSLKVATANNYVEYEYKFIGMRWVLTSKSSIPIAGYKVR